MAKIEKAEAITNLDEIIEATDGLMVARGDLGVETSVELVPVYQKRIIEGAIAHDKFVITATQMLQSMIDNPRPTRAEASDVANAVWDGTDAVMLSAETAAGKFPVQAVRTMAKIIDSAETLKPSQLRRPIKFSQKESGRTSQALCKAAAYCAQEKQTNKIAVFTESGLMARRLSAFRSGLQTFALTTSKDARSQLALIWGVTPYQHEPCDSTEGILKSRRTNSARQRRGRRRRINGYDGWSPVGFGTFEFGRRLDNRRRRAAQIRQTKVSFAMKSCHPNRNKKPKSRSGQLARTNPINSGFQFFSSALG